MKFLRPEVLTPSLALLLQGDGDSAASPLKGKMSLKVGELTSVKQIELWYQRIEKVV